MKKVNYLKLIAASLTIFSAPCAFAWGLSDVSSAVSNTADAAKKNVKDTQDGIDKTKSLKDSTQTSATSISDTLSTKPKTNPSDTNGNGSDARQPASQ